MTYLKRIGFGAIIWAAIFVAISILIALKATSPWISYPLGWIITIWLGWYFAKVSQVKGTGNGILTGVLFVIPALVLDYFVTTRYTGMGLFGAWNIWVGYALLILVPTFYGFKNK